MLTVTGLHRLTIGGRIVNLRWWIMVDNRDGTKIGHVLNETASLKNGGRAMLQKFEVTARSLCPGGHGFRAAFVFCTDYEPARAMFPGMFGGLARLARSAGPACRFCAVGSACLPGGPAGDSRHQGGRG